MPGKDFRIGILAAEGLLHTDSGSLLLTTIPMQGAQAPETQRLVIDPMHIGKMALVQGDLSGQVLYSAAIVEVIPPTTSSLLKTMIERGTLSYEELQDTLEAETERDGDGKRKLCALVIGHKKTSPGAVNQSQALTEFEFNDNLAMIIEKKVRRVDVQRVYRRTWKDLPDDINALKPTLIVSLHCNAFNQEASGTEVLYYHKSSKGKRMAEILLGHLVDHLKLKDRGAKARSAEDRGGNLLRYTKAPCVIAEPFFIDNDQDLQRAQDNIDGFASAYATGIEEAAQDL